MKPKLALLLVVIVIAPLAISGWLGARIVRDEQVVVRHRFRELVLGQLRAVDVALVGAVGRFREAVIAEMPSPAAGRDELRRRTRDSPYVTQYYVLGTDGRFAFPPVAAPSELTAGEREALQRTRQVWEAGSFAGLAARGENSADSETSGWHVWYWGGGAQWMLWKKEGAHLVVAEVNRARFIAELIGALPETDALAPELARGRITFSDSALTPLYEWGGYEAPTDVAAVASLTPSAPLGAWTIEYHAAEILGSTVASSFYLNLTVGLLLLAGAVIGLTSYFYRAQSRELRAAAQRVSFVNQVSHELKTPLTSIRLYAELLEDRLEDGDDEARRQLGVIVSESQRLSRLIANVLTFARAQRGTLELHRKPAVVDEILREVLERFAPALAAGGIAVSFAPCAAERALVDRDAVEQILGNLVSNVEKYAASGKRLEVTSQQNGDLVEVVVADAGPGLARKDERRVFEPFVRVSNALTEGVSGTGMGLTIARDLARLHGGDLTLVSGQGGARFRVTLRCAPVGAEEGAE